MGLTTIGVIAIPLVAPLWPVLMIISGAVLIFSGFDTLSRTRTRPLKVPMGRIFQSNQRTVKEDLERPERGEREEQESESGTAD